ncbi:MAG TPA: VanZ family protein [Leucothrix sp.]|nr:VanZ family protein [Leucothrix sp.]
MHHLIILVRHLRRIAAFEISTRTLVIFLMVLGAWVATQKLELPPTFSLNDKVTHIVVFFGFSVLMDLAIDRHPFWLWKGLPLLIYGAGIEILQYFSPDRMFSMLDWLADFFGIFLYFLLKIIILWWDASKDEQAKNDKLQDDSKELNS